MIPFWSSSLSPILELFSVLNTTYLNFTHTPWHEEFTRAIIGTATVDERALALTFSSTFKCSDTK